MVVFRLSWYFKSVLLSAYANNARCKCKALFYLKLILTRTDAKLMCCTWKFLSVLLKMSLKNFRSSSHSRRGVTPSCSWLPQPNIFSKLPAWQEVPFQNWLPFLMVPQTNATGYKVQKQEADKLTLTSIWETLKYLQNRIKDNQKLL